jgi:hypothetical protein
MAAESSPARALASQLIARAQRSGRDSADRAQGAAATAFHALSHELSRWLGAGGCHALLTRALRQARTAHPALLDVEIASDSHLRLRGLDDAVEAHGAPALAAGVEAMLVATFELLGRLVGDDVSTRLVELSMSDDVPDAAKSEAERRLQ